MRPNDRVERPATMPLRAAEPHHFVVRPAAPRWFPVHSNALLWVIKRRSSLSLWTRVTLVISRRSRLPTPSAWTQRPASCGSAAV